MDTSNKQEFWENLMAKYAGRNKELEEREENLRARIDAMQTLIDSGQNGGRSKDKCTCEPPPTGFFSCLKKAWCTGKGDTAKPEVKPTAVPEPTQKEAEGIPYPTSAFLKNGNAASPPSDKPGDVAKSSPVYVKKNSNCSCNPWPDEETVKVIHEPEILYTKNPKCACSPCPLDKLLMQQEVELQLQQVDNASLNSMDLFYMQNLKDMAGNCKKLNQQVKTFEQKEKAFQDVLKEYAGMNTDNICTCNSKKQKDDNEKKCADLQLENFLLKNELREMRLEIRQYMERMEAPMLFKIESEKYKNQQLEMKLEEAAMEILKQEELCEKETNQLKMELCSANMKNYRLNEQCEEMQKENADLTAQIEKLSEDLLRQKISDAEIIIRLKAEIDKLRQQLNTPQKECDLFQIARELSGDLKACEPCIECANVPSDIKATVRHIKELTDAVNEHFPEDEPGEISEPGTPNPEETETTGRSAGDEQGGGEGPDETADERGAGEGPDETADESSSVRSRRMSAEAAPAQSSRESGEEASSAQHRRSSIPSAAAATQPTTEPCTCLDPTQKKKLSSSVRSAAATQPTTAPCTCLNPTTKKKLISCTCIERSTKMKVPCAERDPCIYPKSICPCPLPPEVGCGGPLPPPPPVTSVCTCKELKQPPPPPRPRPSAAKDDCGCNSPQLSSQLMPPPSLPEDDCGCNPPKNKLSCLASDPKCLSLEELCKCLMEEAESEAIVEPETERPVQGSNSERLRVSHSVGASPTRDILKSITSVKAMKVAKNFPLVVDTTVDVIDKPPDGVHVTTTITQSGSLLVVTEGPEGIIETNLVYSENGDVEVVTEILDYKAAGIGCKKKAKKDTPAITEVEQATKEVPDAKKEANENCACAPNCPNVPTTDTEAATTDAKEESANAEGKAEDAEEKSANAEGKAADAEETSADAEGKSANVEPSVTDPGANDADAKANAEDAEAKALDTTGTDVAKRDSAAEPEVAADTTAKAPEGVGQEGQSNGGTEVAIPDGKDKVEASLSFHLRVDNDENAVNVENKVSIGDAANK